MWSKSHYVEASIAKRMQNTSVSIHYVSYITFRSRKSLCCSRIENVGRSPRRGCFVLNLYILMLEAHNNIMSQTNQIHTTIRRMCSIEGKEFILTSNLDYNQYMLPWSSDLKKLCASKLWLQKTPGSCYSSYSKFISWRPMHFHSNHQNSCYEYVPNLCSLCHGVYFLPTLFNYYATALASECIHRCHFFKILFSTGYVAVPEWRIT